MCTRTEVVDNKLEERIRNVEDRGLKINIQKTVYLRFNGDGNLDGNSHINLQGHNLKRIGREWTLGCRDDAYNTIMMEKLEERVSEIL